MNRLLHQFTRAPSPRSMETLPGSSPDNPINLEGTTEQEGNTQSHTDNQEAAPHDGSGDTEPESDRETDRDTHRPSAAPEQHRPKSLETPQDNFDQVLKQLGPVEKVNLTCKDFIIHQTPEEKSDGLTSMKGLLFLFPAFSTRAD